MTLPLIAPAVAAGAMLAFALSFDDLVVTSFNAGVGSTTLPIFIYSSIKFGVTPQINAISTIIVAVVSIALFIAWRLGAFRGREARVTTSRSQSRPDSVGRDARLHWQRTLSGRRPSDAVGRTDPFSVSEQRVRNAPGTMIPPPLGPKAFTGGEGHAGSRGRRDPPINPSRSLRSPGGALRAHSPSRW